MRPQSLSDVAYEVALGAIAGSTKVAYEASERKRRELAAQLGLDEECPMPLVAYVLQKVTEGAAASSIGVATAGLAFATGMEQENNAQRSIISAAKATMSRTRKVKHHKHAGKEAVKTIIRCALREEADREDWRIRVAVALMFSALLRSSETVALLRGDVVDGGETVEVRVRRAKNDQQGEGRATFIGLVPGSEGRQLWDKYTKSIPSGKYSPSFSTGNPLSTDHLRKELKRVYEEASVEKLTPHQLRGGEASAALEEVQVRGRWQSREGMAPYIKDSIEAQRGVMPM